MLENEPTDRTENLITEDGAAAPTKARKTPAKRAPRKAAAKAPAEMPTTAEVGRQVAPDSTTSDADRPAEAAQEAPKKATRARKSAAKRSVAVPVGDAAPADTATSAADATAPTKTAAKKSPRKRAAKTSAVTADAPTADAPTADAPTGDVETDEVPSGQVVAPAPALSAPVVLFQPPAEAAPSARRRRAAKVAAEAGEPAGDQPEKVPERPAESEGAEGPESEDLTEAGGRRRRRRGRRGRGSRATELGDGDEDLSESGQPAEDESADEDETEPDHADEVAEAALSASARRRRRRRRSTTESDAGSAPDDPPNTVVHVRDVRSGGARGGTADEDGVRGVKGSTRLEAKRQRRRDNRDSGRRRAPILTEAEFLARRESVERVMAVRQTGDRTQIAVLEDGILVEHYVTRASSASAVGNVYLGRVQNVLPSMEAAFVDIGRGRNGVLYAGEVNWDAAGLEGKARSIESALSSGDTVLVQVTKDPIGHKGARLTSQISLPGRFLVYVPGGGMTGISRKLPDTERTRLKAILKKVVPEDAGVIVRTAAEGASDADLISDVERLKSQWETIRDKAKQPGGNASLVYGEPDLAIRVVRDVFNDDFKKLIVAGSDTYATIAGYVSDVAPDLADRISMHTADSDVFADLRVDEQLAKALDRKVWLPSGGSLVIDRTEAMTVIDVNTGKYTGSGGNLEQTVTRNNLEAAEEIVRQLRLRDIGGIIVIDFIDMVLESNRDLVLRRLTECLGRDRTKHQVAEVTSLGLVQMTRKRVGEGLLEAFSEPCEHCKGRGVIVHTEPVDKRTATAPALSSEDERSTRGKRARKAKDAPAAASQADAEALARADEQRRAAASAIAAIAAATSHHDDAASAQAAAEAVQAVEEVAAIATEVALEATAGREEAEAPGVTAVTTTRPRRRRAASRPAGPPVEASAAEG
jgi:ribonuclease E